MTEWIPFDVDNPPERGAKLRMNGKREGEFLRLVTYGGEPWEIAWRNPNNTSFYIPVDLAEYVEVEVPKLELPTEPGSVFWGRISDFVGVRYTGRIWATSGGWFSPGKRTGTAFAFGASSVTRLPWPKDDLEKFKAGLS